MWTKKCMRRPSVTRGRGEEKHGPLKGAPNVSCKQLLPSIKHEYESSDNIIFTVITLQLCRIAVGSLPGARWLVRCNKSRCSICITRSFRGGRRLFCPLLTVGGLMRSAPHLLQPRGLHSNPARPHKPQRRSQLWHERGEIRRYVSQGSILKPRWGLSVQRSAHLSFSSILYLNIIWWRKANSSGVLP